MTTSVGSLLKAQREKRRLTLDDAHRLTKIHPKFLKALEDNDYSVFDGKVHAKGFLKIYSDFLGLELSEIMAFWRREHEPGIEKSAQSKVYELKPLERERFVLTPGLVVSVVMGILVMVFFGYLYYQYKSYTGNPDLKVFSPENNKTFETDIVDVTGRTELDTEVFINNQKVVLNPNGDFAASIKLKEGINTLGVTAVNKLGRKTEDIRTVIFRPEKRPVTVPEVPTVPEASQSTP